MTSAPATARSGGPSRRAATQPRAMQRPKACEEAAHRAAGSRAMSRRCDREDCEPCSGDEGARRWCGRPGLQYQEHKNDARRRAETTWHGGPSAREPGRSTRAPAPSLTHWKWTGRPVENGRVHGRLGVCTPLNHPVEPEPTTPPGSPVTRPRTAAARSSQSDDLHSRSSWLQRRHSPIPTAGESDSWSRSYSGELQPR